MKKKNLTIIIAVFAVSFVGCDQEHPETEFDAGPVCFKPTQDISTFDLVSNSAESYCAAASESSHIPFNECVQDMIEDTCEKNDCEKVVKVSLDLEECFYAIEHQTRTEISLGRLPNACECSKRVLCPLDMDGLSCENNRSDQP